MTQRVVTVSIASGDTVNGNLDLSGGRLRAIAVPTVDSGDMFLRGSFDTTSAGFVRIQSPVFGAPTSGDLRLATGPGSKMILWPDNLPSPSYARLEMAVAQTAPRSFSVRFGGK